MARKKIRTFINLVPIIIILIICLSLIIFSVKFFKNYRYFKIKEIICSDRDKLTEINKILDLKGKNIFSVDLKTISKSLKDKYPEAAEIDVLRKFPNKLVINFTKRIPIAKFKISHNYYVIDKEGMILGYLRDFENWDLTTLSGLDITFKDFKIGQRVRSKKLSIALFLLKQINDLTPLRRFRINDLDISNLNKISFFLGDIQILIRREDSNEKLEVLVSLIDKISELGKISYIDLRFKDPVIKKR